TTNAASAPASAAVNTRFSTTANPTIIFPTDPAVVCTASGTTAAVTHPSDAGTLFARELQSFLIIITLQQQQSTMQYQNPANFEQQGLALLHFFWFVADKPPSVCN